MYVRISRREKELKTLKSVVRFIERTAASPLPLVHFCRFGQVSSCVLQEEQSETWASSPSVE